MDTSEDENMRAKCSRIFFQSPSRRLLLTLTALIFLSSLSALTFLKPEVWGFYGHRKINYMAVFTLPIDLIPFYKHHIAFVSEHAVDPDIRRYATEYEAVRHYIDIDHWGDKPFEEVPRDFTLAIAKYGVIQVINVQGDTSLYDFGYSKALDSLENVAILDINTKSGFKAFQTFLKFIEKDVERYYYEEEWPILYDRLNGFEEIKWEEGSRITLFDRFSSYGILPFYLEQHYAKLVWAFKEKQEEQILRLSADMGHYIGDAHVPLHTTVNYNGQLTDQLGIHAFWESRIPELSAETEYDFFVGKAKYIKDKKTYFWNIIQESNALVADVLRIEKELSQTFASDGQYCYDERLNKTVRIECPEYAKAYETALRGSVEERMRSSIHAVGSVWYSAWVDAGKPKLPYGVVELRDTLITISEESTKVRSK